MTEENKTPDVSARLLTEKEISRKTFLKGGGTVVLGLSVVGAAQAATTPATLPAHSGAFPSTTATPDATQIDNYLQINPDNTATLYTGWVELGQGSPTAVRMIAAEELGMSFDQVSTAPVDTNVSLSAVTVGSLSTKTAFGNTSLRGAAAAARTILLGMAAKQLGVPAANLTVSNGVISGGSAPLKYSDLMAGKLFNSTIAAVNPTFVDPSKFKIVGTNVPREDIPAIVMAKTTYVQNVRVPGMLHGRVVRPRGQAALGKGAKVLSVDPKSISHIPGAQVLQKGDFLGVVAPKEYDAIQAAAQLKVTWDNTASLPGSGNLDAALRKNGGQAVQYTNGVLTAQTVPDAFAVQLGNPGAALATAAKTASRSYFSAYNGHVPIGPNCAVADVNVKGGQATIICFSQLPYSTRTLVTQAINQTLGLLDNSNPAVPNNPTAGAWNANQVRVQWFPASGTYGHSELDDATVAATIMSTLAGKPVRVQLMRWDETGWDQLAPAQATDITAGIDAKGNIVAYQYQSFQHGSMSVETSAELAGVKLPLTEPTGTADSTSSASYYDKIPNRTVLSKKVGSYHGFLKGTYLRAPAAPQSLFASEQMIDELAQLAGMDPIAFRKLNMSNDPNGAANSAGLQGSRWNNVMDAVAKAASWVPKVPASNLKKGDTVTGRGFAIGGFSNARPALIADVTVNMKSGKITCTHLYCAMDLGTAVNPGMVENQMVGSMVMGASRALFEATKFSKVRQTSLDWVSYPIMRFKDSPKVTTVVLQRLDQTPDGAGEPAEAPVAAAIGNAFFDATGVRLTQMPMTPSYVLSQLKAAGVA
jgi:nicotinate dehydrogenase subunit B